MSYQDSWPKDELLDVLDMIKAKISQAYYISDEQKNALFEIIDMLADDIY